MQESHKRTQTPKEVRMSYLVSEKEIRRGFVVKYRYGGCYTGQPVESTFIVTDADKDVGICDLLELVKDGTGDRFESVPVEDLKFVLCVLPINPGTNTMADWRSTSFMKSGTDHDPFPPEWREGINRANLWIM
ncbi:MAG: hypothetical protein O3B64_02790 [bacterium]|nr:hypothetical protein [bacterium]